MSNSILRDKSKEFAKQIVILCREIKTEKSYVGELVFNMLVLVGSVKMADRIVREMMGL